MWSYVGEKYTFWCEDCGKFIHSDNRDRQMKDTFVFKDWGGIPENELTNYKKELANLNQKYNINIEVFQLPKDK
jgi:agmatine/peptidylarginine deiminase